MLGLEEKMLVRANDILTVAKKEYDDFCFKIAGLENIEAARERLDFRREVLMAIMFTIFNEKEHDIIIKRNDFLDICWKIHIKYNVDAADSIDIAGDYLSGEAKINDLFGKELVNS